MSVRTAGMDRNSGVATGGHNAHPTSGHMPTQPSMQVLEFAQFRDVFPGRGESEDKV